MNVIVIVLKVEIKMENKKDFLEEHIEIMGVDEETKKKLMDKIKSKLGKENETKTI